MRPVTSEPLFELEAFEYLPATAGTALVRVAGTWQADALEEPSLVVSTAFGDDRIAPLPDSAGAPVAGAPWRAAFSLALHVLTAGTAAFALEAGDDAAVELPQPSERGEPGFDRVRAGRELGELRAANDRLTARVEDLEGQLAAAQQELKPRQARTVAKAKEEAERERTVRAALEQRLQGHVEAEEHMRQVLETARARHQAEVSEAQLAARVAEAELERVNEERVKLEQRIEELAEGEGSARGAHGVLEAGLADLRSDREVLRRELAAARRQAGEGARQAERNMRAAQEAGRRAADAERAASEWEAKLDAAARRLTEAQEQALAAERRAEQAEKGLEYARAAVAAAVASEAGDPRAEAALEEARTEADAARAEMARLRGELDALRVSSAEVTELVEGRAEEAIAAVRAEFGRALAEAERRRVEAERVSAEAGTRAEAAQQRAVEAREQAQAAEARAREAEQGLEYARAAVAAAMATEEAGPQAEAALQEARSAADAARREADGARDEAAQLRGELEALRSASAEVQAELGRRTQELAGLQAESERRMAQLSQYKRRAVRAEREAEEAGKARDRALEEMRRGSRRSAAKRPPARARPRRPAPRPAPPLEVAAEPVGPPLADRLEALRAEESAAREQLERLNGSGDAPPFEAVDAETKLERVGEELQAVERQLEEARDHVERAARSQLKRSSRTALREATARLAESLAGGEEVLYMAAGGRKENRRLLAATDRRLLVVEGPDSEPEGLRYDEVESVQVASRGTLQVSTKRGQFQLEDVAGDLDGLVQHVNERIWGLLQDAEPATAPAGHEEA